MQQIPTDLRGMAQAQGNDALLSQVLPAGISGRSHVARSGGNMVAFRGDSHSSLGARQLLIRRANSTNVIPPEAGSRTFKACHYWFGWIPGQARNDEIHSIFWLDQ